MSFRCALTDRVRPHGEKPVGVVREKRSREYWSTKDGKAPDPNWAYESPPYVVGHGWEVVREAFVSKDGLAGLNIQLEEGERT